VNDDHRNHHDEGDLKILSFDYHFSLKLHLFIYAISIVQLYSSMQCKCQSIAHLQFALPFVSLNLQCEVSYDGDLVCQLKTHL
jgi:hypothetical protein